MFLGAGPGDPDLLMVHDRLVTAEVLSLALLIDCGKRHSEQGRIQDDINQALVEHAQAGRKVVRLKTGGPMIFGRGAEHLVRDGIEVEVTPGVSSAVPSLAGIPPTCRGMAACFAVIARDNREYIAEGLIQATLGSAASGRVEVSAPAVFAIGDVAPLRDRLTNARLAGECVA